MMACVVSTVFILTCAGVLLAQQLHDSSFCGCPDGWMYMDGSCYLFADNVRMSWTEAAHFCMLHRSNLVTIDHQKEDLFVQDHALKLFRNVDDREQRPFPAFWTGATDEVVEGAWAWYTDDSDLGYTNWYPGQPDNYHHLDDEDCMLLFGALNFTWHDGSCGAKHFPLCEMVLSEKSSSIIG